MLSHYISVLKQTVWFLLFALLVGTFTLYVIAFIQYGFLTTSANFMMEYVGYYQLQITVAMAIFVFFGLSLHTMNLEKKLKERSNCSISSVTLEELSKIWLPSERHHENIKAKLSEEVSDEFDLRLAVMTTLNFTHKDSIAFFERFIKPYLRYISVKELVVIRDLLVILEKEGGCPSVTQVNKKDPETKMFMNAVRENGKSNYEIYATFSLYDHSLRVAKKMFERVAGGDQDYNIGWQLKIGKAIVISLAHDIGKIETIRHLQIAQPNKIREVMSHAEISGLMFKDAFFDYEDVEEMSKLIENHHVAQKDGDRLGVYLVNADKEARQEEFIIWKECERDKIDRRDAYKNTIEATVVPVQQQDQPSIKTPKPPKSEPESFDLWSHLQQTHDQPGENEGGRQAAAEKPGRGTRPTGRGAAKQEDTVKEVTAAREEPKKAEKIEKAEAPEAEAHIPEEKSAGQKSITAEEAQKNFFKTIRKDEGGQGAGEDTATIMDETLQPPAKPARPAKQRSRRESNEHLPEVDAVEFDFNAVELKFKNAVMLRLNSKRDNGSPACVTYKNKILLSIETAQEILDDILNPETFESKFGLFKHLCAVLYARGVATEPNIAGGSYFSVYYFGYVKMDVPRKLHCIAIDGEYIGMGTEQLLADFRKSELSEYRIERYGKK